MLASLGFGLGAFLVWWLLPRFASRLPRDRGRSFAVNPEASIGKPTGAGIILLPLYALVCLLVVPWTDRYPESPWGIAPFEVLLCTLLALAVGYLDDRARAPWSDLKKGVTDLAIAFSAALATCQLQSVQMWLPFYPAAYSNVELSPALYIPIATALLWISINTTNCTDGVDGLSGSLLLLACIYLGGILYVVIGHQDVAKYLGVPHNPHGADWAIMAFALTGILVGYLWYNANPSSVLMGDAGSRPLGLLLGVFALVTGNPFILFIVAGVVLVNGGAGLVKVALLRFFKIGILRNIRFPLHDHCRKNLHWSNTQVLVRFMILQAVLTPLLIVLFLKVR